MAIISETFTKVASVFVIVEELKSEKILVQHLETVTSSEATFDVLRSFVVSYFCATICVHYYIVFVVRM